jgi:hypothetical protein
MSNRNFKKKLHLAVSYGMPVRSLEKLIETAFKDQIIDCDDYLELMRRYPRFEEWCADMHWTGDKQKLD